MKEEKMPKLKRRSFICPICNAFSSFTWDLKKICRNEYNIWEFESPYGNRAFETSESENEELHICTCENCKSYLLWRNDKMIYPIVSLIPSPNVHMPQDVKDIYEEARKVYPYSKKSSSALLRLALQLLCKELGKGGKNINDDIKSLVQDGLSPMIQKSLDIIRVTGNEAVHPGVIDFTDEDNDIAFSLFKIMNLIVEKMIVEPKEIEEIYNQLPEDKRKAIENRDKQINN